MAEAASNERGALRHHRAAENRSEMVNLGDVAIDLDARSITLAGTEVHLAPKEYAMLAELARHCGHVITHTQLLRAVWGPGHEQDVEYLRGIRRKLETDPATPVLLRNEPGVGYRLMG